MLIQKNTGKKYSRVVAHGKGYAVSVGSTAACSEMCVHYTCINKNKQSGENSELTRNAKHMCGKCEQDGGGTNTVLCFAVGITILKCHENGEN